MRACLRASSAITGACACVRSAIAARSTARASWPGSIVAVAVPAWPYRIRPEKLRAQFERLWEREMFMGSYDARWLRAQRLDEEERFRSDRVRSCATTRRTTPVAWGSTS